MQLIELPPLWAGLLCVALWPVFQVAAALFCLHLQSRYLSVSLPLFRPRRWEQGGAFYEKVFRVRRWKRFLPDGGAVMRGGYRKKHLNDRTPEGLQQFLTESCRAELTHLLAILPFWVFGLFTPPGTIWIMLCYALAVNLPCIIAQRYNRPRFLRLLQRQQGQTPTTAEGKAAHTE